jgi:hypothetical protein
VITAIEHDAPFSSRLFFLTTQILQVALSFVTHNRLLAFSV